jgi:adenylate kinase
MARGGLIPDDLVTELVQAELKKNTKPGFILDGFPRTLKQAEILDAFCHVDFAVHISLQRWAIIEKLKGRLVCKGCGQGFNSADIITPPYHMPALVQDKHACNKGYDYCLKNGVCESRNDDTDEVINARLNTYDESIAPILKFYRNSRKLKNFDVYTGVGDTDALVEAMLRSDADCSAPEHAQ